MITNPIVLWALVACAASLTAASVLPFAIPHLTRIWRQATPFGRFAFCIATLSFALYAGTKTNQVDQTSGETNNAAPPLMMAFAPPRPFDNFDFELVSVTTNESLSYELPSNGCVRGTWHLTGAYEDVRPVSLDGFAFLLGESLYDSFWAHTWGKVRPQLKSASNEIAAVGAPMSALPEVSRFWTAATSNDAYLLTWQDFALGRATTNACANGQLAPANCPLVSAQIELLRNGNFITRSNTVERFYRRHVPGVETEGYGPHPPEGVEENTNAYYTIDLVVHTADARVAFTGDGPSNLPDPNFIARAGATNGVELLIGKTYTIRCSVPFEIIGASDSRIAVYRDNPNQATVVWPVTIYMDYGTPRLTGLLAAPRLAASSGTPKLCVDPNWLNGTVSMSADVCCGVSGTGGEFELACQDDDCGCGGCTISGTYTYEGYTIDFDSLECGCTEHEPEDDHDLSEWGFSVPAVVFKDGALRELGIWFDPGEDDDNSGDLVLTQTQGQEKVRIWANERKTALASQFSWPVADGVGCTYYIEGVETSDSAEDIEFKLEWVKGNDIESGYRQMTCAEVVQTEVTSALPDGSPNRQPFAGHTNWEFNITHSPHPDKHYAVLFRDVVNNDFSVRDFSVTMTLVVEPTDAPVGTARWFALDPTPNSGSIVSTGARVGELQNPRVGGVYHIASCFSGSPTNECNIVLPLAGAEMYNTLAADLDLADQFAAEGKSKLPRRWVERIKFGCKWFLWQENGYYRGRPNNEQHPTVWPYNQIDNFGFGAIGTLRGRPIRVEKLSNLIAGYTCVKLGVSRFERILAQSLGTTNDLAATLSWLAGENIANGVSFDLAVSNLVVNANLGADEKTSKLWPNTAPVDNHRPYSGHDDFDYEFSSPGFIYANP